MHGQQYIKNWSLVVVQTQDATCNTQSDPDMAPMKVGRKKFHFFFFNGSTALVVLSLFNAEVWRSHSDTPHSVGLLWTSNQPDTETSTHNRQHPQEADILAPGGFRSRNPGKRAIANAGIRPRGHRDRQKFRISISIYCHRRCTATTLCE